MAEYCVVDLLRVVNLLTHCDLLSRRTLCGHHLPGNYRHVSSQGRVCGVVNMEGVVKTLRRSNLLFLFIVVVLLVRKGPLGTQIIHDFGCEKCEETKKGVLWPLWNPKSLEKEG